MAWTKEEISRLGLDAQRQIPQAAGGLKRSKYGSRKEPRTLPDGGVLLFDSVKEARRYDELMLLLNAGEIRELKLQPQYTLTEAYMTPDGHRIKATRYQADFSYKRPSQPDAAGVTHWIPVVEDVKSEATKTRVYALKKKLLRETHGIEIQEV